MKVLLAAILAALALPAVADDANRKPAMGKAAEVVGKQAVKSVVKGATKGEIANDKQEREHKDAAIKENQEKHGGPYHKSK